MPEIVPLSTAPIKPFSLSSPVRMLTRPTLSVEKEDSLALASNRFLQNGSNFLPVLNDGKLVGIISGRGLANALGNAAEFSDAVSDYIEPAQTIPSYATGAEALRAFVEGEPLVVVDDDLRLVGLIAPADLYPKHRPRLRPLTVGGMATPLGVYLTTGVATSGVPRYALILSGATMSVMIYTAVFASKFFGFWLRSKGLVAPVAEAFEMGTTALLFCAFFRLLPLSGTHGAEHQVVHAIERELELTPEIVRRMPRYHPRCGTNYSVAFGLFVATFGVMWTDQEGARLLLAIAVTVALFRPLGRFAQTYITTKTPTPKQLDQAIDAGEELIDNYATARTGYPTPLKWLWNSGILFVLIGLLGVGTAISTLAYFLKLPWL